MQCRRPGYAGLAHNAHVACAQSTPSLAPRRPNGEPFTDKSLYKLFWTSCYRLTGKRTNPHLVRDSIVTFLRGGGATERELEVNARSGK